MKNALLLTTGIFILTLFASCGSNKDLQERSPAQFNEVYYTYNSNGIELNIPITAIQDQRISMDAVYFHGMKSKLEKSQEKPNLYVANFRMGSDDMVMHEDPKQEYGNKPPQLPEESPFSIEEDEAILVFTQNDKIKYYKLTGIVEKE
ncbi:hypothetical protein [Christiangramia forsetii]|uniref:Membrane or secreted protein n=2 Tax=Christiangramia forsetii TaxID=411153 RepID=A0M6G2_CHRFK|nr:hypothetical protein [Christiangramia forsetii]GGG30494.1 hypothetical protein GCM10011532_12500 [Christiangramia forsetii]CAL68207.1 membrane or secreted protein [Christiangramia forsetii KT0803]